MEPFLLKVAKALLKGHPDGLRDVAVVLPSQRAGMYLQKHLAQEAGKTLWSPQLLTVRTFMETLAGSKALPMEELILEGYAAYREAEGEQAEDFNEYLQWAGTALPDISEADAHLVELESYYRNLRDWEELEWSFREDPLSKAQRDMISYWGRMKRLHLALDKRLRQEQTGTMGLVERIATEQLAEHTERWRTVWFVGLNAFTPAQKKAVEHFRQAGKARFAWDMDKYYLDDRDQEAGLYLRENTVIWGQGEVPPVEALTAGDKRIRSVRVPNGVAQAWYAAKVVKEMTEAERSRTAIVLADGSLLAPLLQALPTDVGPVNVTMGLPISQLPVGAFIEAVLALHAGMVAGRGFFHADVDRFLSHPFLRRGSDARQLDRVMETIRKNQRVYSSAAFLADALKQAGAPTEAEAIFRPVENVREEMPAILAQALAWAKRHAKGDKFATEQLFQVSKVLQRINALLERYPIELDQRAYATLFNRLLRSASVGLYGEPLQGVQIMGMLEARALDHEHLILLGTEEGTLPTAGPQRSFIPFALRRVHHMPMPEDNEAVQAYNFMRMLQRAWQADLVWADQEDVGPSRFIRQVEHELRNGEQASVQRTEVRIDRQEPHEPRVEVVKSAAVLDKLKDYLRKGLSPSALNTWLRCPLDFYFQYVQGLRTSDDVGIRIGADVLGSAVHNAMEAIYRPLLERPLTVADLEKGAKEVEALILSELKEKLTEEQLDHGQPLLQRKMAVLAAQRFLRGEAGSIEQGATITPLRLEVKLEGELAQATQAIGSTVVLGGRLDRVDRADGQLRILDLKTGGAHAKQLELTDLDPERIDGQKGFALQLLVYAWLYLQENPQEESVQAGLLPLRKKGSEPVLLRVGNDPVITRSHMPDIEALITGLVERIMDPQEPLGHDPDSRYCAFCLRADEWEERSW